VIDFHFNVDHPVNYACRVVRKARHAGKTVLVYTRDAPRQARLDLALWTFSALDFLPHVARQRFKSYREAGFAPLAHEVANP